MSENTFSKLGIFFDEEVQHLIDSFSYCFKVQVTIYSANMERQIIGLDKPIARFCQLIQNDLHCYYRCSMLDKKMCESCEKRPKMLTYKCYAGLTESVMPIVIDGSLIGYAMLGQFRTEESMNKEILAEWSKTGLPTTTLTSAFLESPLIDKATVESMCYLFQAIVTFMITNRYFHRKRLELVEYIVQWLENHLDEDFTLENIADAINRSKSTVSHVIKKQLGMSFKKLCTIKRIERFESIITKNPGISIQEAAARVGYDDPLYFSRIYKMVRHNSPSIFVKQIRNK